MVLLQQHKMLQHYNPAMLPPAPSWWHGSANDHSHAFTTIALSGYGIMWNPHYLRIRDLPVPKSWQDLLDPRYADHIGFTPPSRSGTAHVIVENILQTMGWKKGWDYLLQLSGNLSDLTARSFGTRHNVAREFFGIG